ncbi:helix-turn-helix domain-containing protein [Novosphingobium sp. HII-3]|uniref:helix-turn-helix domain-containing protein n=1 Tax=Novosphingobium sp. HII-3 TaxID=2075565 RepID=UPI000CDAE680|nr:helix-turn-helix domain-containing protein [Novosphingobium sp. HII-3]
MSSEAVAWAFKQDIKPSGLKFTLVAMAECANYKTGLVFASTAHLCEITSQDRKTVLANQAELEKRGFIEDTGERAGKTKQIKVYRPVIGTVPETEQSQKRNSSVSPGKESQKRDTEPSYEPSLPTETTSPTVVNARDEFPCPAGCDPIDWGSLLKTRKAARKPMTAGAYRQITKKLESWEREGWPPGPILAHAVERGWQTVFETDEMRGSANANNRSYAGSHSSRHPGKPKDGAIAALDRRLGLDESAGEREGPDRRPSTADRSRALAGPGTLY